MDSPHLQVGSELLKRARVYSRSPGGSVRKNLFGCIDNSPSNTLESTQSSTTSEYYSQSSMEVSVFPDDSGLSKRLNFDSPQDDGDWSTCFATPRSSPPKRTSLQLDGSFTTTPPALKKPRIFSPSPETPDKLTFRPMSLFSASPESPQYGGSPNTSSGDSLLKDSSPGDVMALSPPRMERLQLYDYPRTPLSIARSSGLAMLSTGKSSQRRNNTRSVYSRIKQSQKLSGVDLSRKVSRGTNINPFTPVELQRRRKIARGTKNPTPEKEGPVTSTPLFDKDLAKPHKKLALRESNISRYKEEFHEVCEIGSGSFGTVYKCINRLDGCVYALKRSHKPVAGSADEAAALREVCAHAVLGSHPYLVRYYSAWAENNHMLIQNEYCNGGNLSSRIAQHQTEGSVFSEEELKRILRHVCSGLQYIHSMGLVHLDIKPDNIFLTIPEPHLPASMSTIMEDECTEDGEPVYKIGDMGLVTSMADPRVEEGDCRYLPREILHDNFEHLDKVDIFALGLTAYSAGSGLDLPKNGDRWHLIRDGHLEFLPNCSPSLNQLLKRMAHPNPGHRPSTTEILGLPIVCPTTQKSKAQLCKELNEEKFKNEILTRELKEAKQKPTHSFGKALSGTKLNRSMSIA